MKLNIFAVVLLLSLNGYAQKGDYYLSNWSKGGTDESKISSDKYSCNEKAKLCYFISNDNDNLTVDIRIEDAGIQNRILKEGMTIWINMDAKKSRTMGVRFPIGSERSGGRSGIPATNPDGSLVTPFSMAKTIELIGFTGESQRRFPSENADTFHGYVKYDKEGVMHYKMVMPISKIPVRNSRDSDGAMPFTFGVEYGEVAIMPGNRGSGGPPPPTGGGSGGSRGGSEGGRRGGMAAGSGQVRNTNISQTAKPPVIFWIKSIKLASDM